MSGDSAALSEREEIEMLLPWFVTGRLERPEALRVEAYLRSHPEMRRQLDVVREEMGVAVDANEAITPPRTLTVERAIELQQATAPARTAGLGLWTRIRSFFDAPTGGAVRFAALAVAAVMLVQAAVIATLLRTERPGFETASGSPTGAEGSFAIVKFSDGANAKAIAEMLGGLGMAIADGPKPGGTFIVRIGVKGLAEAELQRRMAALRSRPDLVQVVLSAR